MLIYKITNKINGKIYIGQTIQKSARKRWSTHCRGIENSAISLSIKKYGKENFLFEVLENCASLEELNKREEFLIQELNTLAPNGYNLKPGGNNHTLPESSRQKISIANSGANNGRFGKQTIPSEETKEKISKSKKGIPNINGRGKTLGRTKEEFSYLAEMGKKQSAQYKGGNNPNARPITVFNVNYSTMKDASKSTGISMYKLRKLLSQSLLSSIGV